MDSISDLGTSIRYKCSRLRKKEGRKEGRKEREREEKEGKKKGRDREKEGGKEEGRPLFSTWYTTFPLLLRKDRNGKRPEERD